MRNVREENLVRLYMLASFRKLAYFILFSFIALSLIACSAQPGEDAEDVLDQIPTSPVAPISQPENSAPPAVDEQPVTILEKFFYSPEEDTCVNSKGQRGYNQEIGECADLTQLSLSGDDLNGKVLKGAKFVGANLSDVDFSNADLRGANFSGANLDAVMLKDAKLDSTKFTDAIFHNSDLSFSKIHDFLTAHGARLGRNNRLPGLNAVIWDVINSPGENIDPDSPLSPIQEQELTIREAQAEIEDLAEKIIESQNIISDFKEKRNFVKNERVILNNQIKENRKKFKSERTKRSEIRQSKKIKARQLRAARRIGDTELAAQYEAELDVILTSENSVNQVIASLNQERDQIKAVRDQKSAEIKDLSGQIKSEVGILKPNRQELRAKRKEQRLAARELKKLQRQLASN